MYRERPIWPWVALLLLVLCVGLTIMFGLPAWERTRYNKVQEVESPKPVEQLAVEPAPTQKVADGRVRKSSPARVRHAVPAAPKQLRPQPVLTPVVVDGSSPSSDAVGDVGAAGGELVQAKSFFVWLRRSWLRPPAPRYVAPELGADAYQAP